MPDDLQARLRQQLDDAMSLCSGTADRPHRPTYMPVGREDGKRYCPVCDSRRACEQKPKRGRKTVAQGLPGVVDLGSQPGGAGNTAPAAEHDARWRCDDA